MRTASQASKGTQDVLWLLYILYGDVDLHGSRGASEVKLRTERTEKNQKLNETTETGKVCRQSANLSTVHSM